MSLQWFTQEIVDIILGLVTGALGFWLRRNHKEYISMRNGVQALLRSEIVRIYGECCLSGYCPVHILDVADLNYQQYIGLGGNGVVKTLIDELHKMPRAAIQNVGGA